MSRFGAAVRPASEVQDWMSISSGGSAPKAVVSGTTGSPTITNNVDCYGLGVLHTTYKFNGDGTITFSAAGPVYVYLLAGGGGGGETLGGALAGSGGGGGGQDTDAELKIMVTAEAWTVNVGAGGGAHDCAEPAHRYAISLT